MKKLTPYARRVSELKSEGLGTSDARYMAKEEGNKLLTKIHAWLKDYELATDSAYGDEDTLDGSAYILLNKIANYLNAKKK